jgi:penicillin-binding protein 2
VVENAGYGATWAAPIATLMMEQYLKGEQALTEVPHLLKKFQLNPNTHADSAQQKNP